MSSKATNQAFCLAVSGPSTPKISWGPNFPLAWWLQQAQLHLLPTPPKLLPPLLLLWPSPIWMTQISCSSDLGDNGAKKSAVMWGRWWNGMGWGWKTCLQVSKILFFLGPHILSSHSTALPEDPPSIPGLDDTMGYHTHLTPNIEETTCLNAALQSGWANLSPHLTYMTKSNVLWWWVTVDSHSKNSR